MFLSIIRMQFYLYIIDFSFNYHLLKSVLSKRLQIYSSYRIFSQNIGLFYVILFPSQKYQSAINNSITKLK
jgi:hypothetical protein